MVTNNPPVLCYHQESLVFVVLQKWLVEAGYQIKYFFEIDVDKQVPRIGERFRLSNEQFTMTLSLESFHKASWKGTRNGATRQSNSTEEHFT